MMATRFGCETRTPTTLTFSDHLDLVGCEADFTQAGGLSKPGAEARRPSEEVIAVSEGQKSMPLSGYINKFGMGPAGSR